MSTTNTSLVERIAAIIAPLEFPGSAGHEQGKCPYCDDVRDDARAQAVTILKAIREPSIAQRKVCFFEDAEITWPAMIDAALQEHEASK